jgi:type IV secretory pathway TrbL component
MATKKDVPARAPRGTKNVTQAFFEAIGNLPESQQEAVATAALAGIRDEMKSRRLKTREAAARAKAKDKARVAAKAPEQTKQPAARGRKVAATKPRAAAAGRKQAAATTPRAAIKVPAKAVRRKQPRKPESLPETHSD